MRVTQRISQAVAVGTLIGVAGWSSIGTVGADEPRPAEPPPAGEVKADDQPTHVAGEQDVAVALAEQQLPPLQFRQHVLNPQSAYSAAAVLDVDRDQRLDIVSGAYLYRGPLWQPEKIRDIELIRGRYDDYANLPFDCNGDGWADLISVNYRSETIFWSQNPAEAAPRKLWAKHAIDRPGPSETGRLVDINNDGRLDLLPNGATYAAWYEFAPSNGRWMRHDLPQELAGHGIGAGDIDGDGRVDLVSPRGWAQQTGASASPTWAWQADFRLHRDASVPILVHDVDQDGDADLVWGRAHDIGVYWLEQQRAADGVSWSQHTIDTSVSSVHAPLLADLDGDGRQDLVAGKRFLGHDGRDPGEYDPLAIYVYRFLPQLKTWSRSTLSWGGPWGIDLDAKAVDLDGDGDVDLVAAARSGLSWYENLARDPAATEPAEETAAVQQAAVPQPVQAAQPSSAAQHLGSLNSAAQGPSFLVESYDHGDLNQVQRQPGPPVPLADLLDWGLRRAHIQRGMAAAMGELPSSAWRVPLDVTVLDESPTKVGVRRRIRYRSSPDHDAFAYLYLPRAGSSPGPAMLCLHPTSSHGKDIIAGGGRDPGGDYALELAEQGYVVVAPDYPTFGDNPVDFSRRENHFTTGHFASGTMRAVWDNLRAVDLLESLPQVDPDRIGGIGHSLGGHNGLFTAAWDQRIRTLVVSCSFTTFADYYGGRLRGWTSDRYMPRIAADFASDPQRMPFDFPEVLGLMAPRSLWINAPVHDENFEVSGVRKCVAAAQTIYARYGRAEALQVRYPEVGHSFPAEERQAVYAWLARELAPR